ncbi:hypothetical protein [Streptomyces sp. ISL-11]|nr:hypothetical protein [Streptomyces sp. ISL-11]MBT2383987.1 hypothetical protein [Streptomyces sp. ISL-11]
MEMSTAAVITPRHPKTSRKVLANGPIGSRGGSGGAAGRSSGLGGLCMR